MRKNLLIRQGNITVIKRKKKVSLFYMLEEESVRSSHYSIGNA